MNEQITHACTVTPFQIEGMPVRGRIVNLSASVDQILKAHNYPERINRLLGHALALTSMLGTMLKYDGILTLQIKGSGPVELLVCDLVADGKGQGTLRGHVQLNKEKLSHYGKDPSFSTLVGQGYFAITIDQGKDMDRYQGIVELKGQTLADCAMEYFDQSEQLPTKLHLSVGQDITADGEFWRAGGIMIQHVPTMGGKDSSEEEIRHIAHDDEEMKDAWRRAVALTSSVKDHELLDPSLTSNELLYRLFHEDGVRAFEPLTVQFGCRCSEERIRDVIANFPADDREHMVENGKIKVTCEFCSTDYLFDPSEFN